MVVFFLLEGNVLRADDPFLAAQVALGVGTLGRLQSYDGALTFMNSTPIGDNA